MQVIFAGIVAGERPSPCLLMDGNQEANARLIAAAPDQHSAGLELDRLALVIESAVRNADPRHHAEVVAVLRLNRAALIKAAVKL